MSEIHRKEDISTWNKLLRPLRKGDKFRVKTNSWRQSWKGWVGIIESDPKNIGLEYFGMAIYWKKNKIHGWCYFSRDEIEVISYG